ncbi:amino acid ABC transporter permease [Desulfospira joergensenii]|uniref:amino acid ABC transporter permease n=1 Tax=Desulfospira joergensenii TaxID=53329 RepID=UPI000402837E|nr:amino acid ABC transporter permease [Desulfospira joergensenii]
MDYNFNYNIMIEYLPDILIGLENTILISVVSMCCAIIWGVAVALARLSHRTWLKRAMGLYVEFIRSTPLLVQIYFLFFGLPEFGIILPAFLVGVFALTLNSGAYAGEIIRAGIESIHQTQYEAADSLAMSYGQKMRYVILPQAFRNILPPLVGQGSYLVKDSALVSVMGLIDLTKAAAVTQATTFRPLEAFLPAMVLYLVIILTLIYGSSFMENKMRRW